MITSKKIKFKLITGTSCSECAVQTHMLAKCTQIDFITEGNSIVAKSKVLVDSCKIPNNRNAYDIEIA